MATSYPPEAHSSGTMPPNVVRLPPEARQVVISVNPKAGRRAAQPSAERLASFLAGRGLHAEIFTDLAEVAGRAAESQAHGALRAVVAAGGDGTIAEIVNRVPAGVPVTVLPLGTENLLAKYLGIGREPESVGAAIAGGTIVRMDAGVATSPRGVWLDRAAGGSRRHTPCAVPADGTRSVPTTLPGRIFLLMASCGLDADVVYRLEQARRGHISHLSYVKPIVAAFRNYGYPPLRIQLRQAEHEPTAAETGERRSVSSTCTSGLRRDARLGEPVVARWMFLFNLPCYAGGLPFTPGASGEDGLFDLCAFERGSFWNGMRYLLAVLRGKHDRLADCTLRRVTELRVEADEPVPFQLDGDFGGYLPLEIGLLPRRLTLVVPEDWAARKLL